MSLYCSDCKNLNPDKNKGGKYFCEAKGKFILACDKICDDITDENKACAKFDISSRSTYENERIYNDSKTALNYSPPSIPRHCCDCKFYDSDKKKGNGTYYCSKNGKYMLAANEECYKFEKSGRSSLDASKMYDEAKEAMKKSDKVNTDNIGSSFLFLILLIILAIILNFII